MVESRKIIRKIYQKKRIIIYENGKEKEINLDGYLIMKSGIICPLFLDRIYMLRPIIFQNSFQNSKLTLEDKVAGFMFVPSPSDDEDRLHNCKKSVEKYNKKVRLAILQYNSMKAIFDRRFIKYFKLI